MVNAIKVLVVEDEALIQDLLQEMLEEGGFAVTMASSGEEAIALLEHAANDFRALVTDIRLIRQAATGWEVAHRARELNPTLPVVYVTGDSAGEWAANGVPGSVLLTKPFAPAQLTTAVANLLNRGDPLAG